MSLGLVKKGSPSSQIGNVGTPTAVQLSANGLRGFYRSQELNSYTVYGQTVYNGQITALDWNGISWTQVPGIGGSTGAGEIYNEGAGFLEIATNGQSVAWDFRYYAPNTFNYRGIQVSGLNPVVYYSFAASNNSAPSSQNSPSITTLSNEANTNVYTPLLIRFSDDASLRFIYYRSGNNLIEVNAGLSGSRPSLLFPSGGTYGDNFESFEVSGDGNHVFVYIGGSLKVFTWNGSNWQFSHSFTTSGYNFSVNYDGSLVAIQNAGSVKIYKKTGSAWGQLGGDLADGTPWVNSTGTLVNLKNLSYGTSALYSWNGSAWEFKWTTFASVFWSGNPLSDNGEVAITPNSAGSIQRYEIQNVAPLYKGSTISSQIFVGTIPASMVYYGSTKLWP